MQQKRRHKRKAGAPSRPPTPTGWSRSRHRLGAPQQRFERCIRVAARCLQRAADGGLPEAHLHQLVHLLRVACPAPRAAPSAARASPGPARWRSHAQAWRPRASMRRGKTCGMGRRCLLAKLSVQYLAVVTNVSYSAMYCFATTASWRAGWARRRAQRCAAVQHAAAKQKPEHSKDKHRLPRCSAAGAYTADPMLRSRAVVGGGRLQMQQPGAGWPGAAGAKCLGREDGGCAGSRGGWARRKPADRWAQARPAGLGRRAARSSA